MNKISDKFIEAYGINSNIVNYNNRNAASNFYYYEGDQFEEAIGSNIYDCPNMISVGISIDVTDLNMIRHSINFKDSMAITTFHACYMPLDTLGMNLLKNRSINLKLRDISFPKIQNKFKDEIDKRAYTFSINTVYPIISLPLQIHPMPYISNTKKEYAKVFNRTRDKNDTQYYYKS